MLDCTAPCTDERDGLIDVLDRDDQQDRSEDLPRNPVLSDSPVDTRDRNRNRHSLLAHEGIFSRDVVDNRWRHILAVNVDLATTYNVALGAFQEALDTDGVLSCHDARERVRVLRSVRAELRVPSVPER